MRYVDKYTYYINADDKEVTINNDKYDYEIFDKLVTNIRQLKNRTKAIDNLVDLCAQCYAQGQQSIRDKINSILRGEDDEQGN